jgi:hypothetical protein
VARKIAWQTFKPANEPPGPTKLFLDALQQTLLDVLQQSDLLRWLFETALRRCIIEGLVGGEGFAVDASRRSTPKALSCTARMAKRWPTSISRMSRSSKWR